MSYEEFFGRVFGPHINRIFEARDPTNPESARGLFRAIAATMDAEVVLFLSEDNPGHLDCRVPRGFLYSKEQKLGEDLSVPANTPILQMARESVTPVVRNAGAGDKIDDVFRAHGIKGLIVAKTKIAGHEGFLVICDTERDKRRGYNLPFTAVDRNLAELIASALSPDGRRTPRWRGVVTPFQELDELDAWLENHESELIRQYGKGHWIAIGRPHDSDDIQPLANGETRRAVREAFAKKFTMPLLRRVHQLGARPQPLELRGPLPRKRTGGNRP